jgi:transposase
MMGRLNHDQEQFFYSFRLDEAVPNDHPVREIAAVLDLSWVHSELAPYYSRLGRPSIDPVLMIRIGPDAVPRCASEPCLSLVLWALD